MTDDDLKHLLQANTRKMRIKFSHAELDRRVRALELSQRALEEGVASLIARLEGSTH